MSNKHNYSTKIELNHDEIHILSGLVNAVIFDKITTSDPIEHVDLENLSQKLYYAHNQVDEI